MNKSAFLRSEIQTHSIICGTLIDSLIAFEGKRSVVGLEKTAGKGRSGFEQSDGSTSDSIKHCEGAPSHFLLFEQIKAARI